MANTFLPDPFSESNQDFFPGADRQILLNELVQLCKSDNNLVAVLGEPGVGKTSFLNQAQLEMAEAAFCCFIEADTITTVADALSQIASQLQLSTAPSDSVDEIIIALRRSIVESDFHRLLIVIDDAHRLDDSILSALFGLLKGYSGQPELHLLIAGDEEISQRLDHSDAEGITAYKITLHPFDHSELREYLQFKLLTAGYPDIESISDKQVAELLEASAGLPAVVNEIAGNLLFQNDLDGYFSPDKHQKLPKLHIILLVILLVALLLALWYPEENESNPQQVVEKNSGINLNNVNKTIVADSAAIDSSLTAQSPPVGPPKQSAEQGIIRNPVKNVSTNQGAIVNSDAPALPITAAKPLTSQETDSDFVAGNRQKDTQSLSRAEQKTSHQEQDSISPPQSVASRSPSVPAVTVKPIQSKQSAKSVSLTKDEQQVMSWPATKYTLQVMAAKQWKGLSDFINGEPNQDRLYLIETRRYGQPWYLVLTGIYDTSDLARQNIQFLPQKQVNTGPWVRKISEIHQDIEANKNQ